MGLPRSRSFPFQAPRQPKTWGWRAYKAWRCTRCQTSSSLIQKPPAFPRLCTHSPHPIHPADTVAYLCSITSLTSPPSNTNPNSHIRLAIEHATGSSRANAGSGSTSICQASEQALAIPYISVAPGSRHSLPCEYTCRLPRDVVGSRIPCLAQSPAFQSPSRCPSQSM